MPNYKAAFEATSLDLAAIMTLLGFTSYPGIDPMLRAVTNLVLAKAEAQALREEVAALRARVVVVPERCDLFEPISYIEGWNACLDEQARLNGKAVSEGLLRGLVQAIEHIVHDERIPNEVSQEVAEVLILAKRSLLDEGKEEDGHA